MRAPKSAGLVAATETASSDTIVVLSREALWPPVVLCLVFAAVFLGLSLWENEVYPISLETQLVILAGVLAFTAGGIGGRRLGRWNLPPTVVPRTMMRLAPTRAALIALMLAFVPVLPRVMEVHKTISAENIYASVSIASAQDEVSWDLLLWVYRLLLALTMFLVVRLARERANVALRRLLVVAITASGLATLVFATRGLILSFIVSLFFASYLTNILSARKLAIGVAVTFLPLFFMAAQLRGHFGGDGGLFADSELLANVIRNYFIGGVAGFDQTVTSREPLDWGMHTLRSVRLWLNTVGFNLPVPPLVEDFRFVPFATNVFTAFEPYYRDFGIAGTIAFPAASGFASCYFLAKARAQPSHEVYVGVAAMLYYPTLMFFFVESYFRLASHWIFIAFGLWTCRHLLLDVVAPARGDKDA
jgi:oligosaccharide repeat unit polymerase